MAASDGRLQPPLPSASCSGTWQCASVRQALLGGHVLLSADESFCYARQFRQFSLHPAVVSHLPPLPALLGAAPGNRLCLVHAVGADGLAVVPSDLVAIVGDVDSQAPHCEMTFAAQQRVGD